MSHIMAVGGWEQPASQCPSPDLSVGPVVPEDSRLSSDMQRTKALLQSTNDQSLGTVAEGLGIGATPVTVTDE